MRQSSSPAEVEIRELFLQILGDSILQVHALAGRNNSQGCFAVADPIHNLPSVMVGLDPGREAYSLDVES